jgi:hypothetical protein
MTVAAVSPADGNIDDHADSHVVSEEEYDV